MKKVFLAAAFILALTANVGAAVPKANYIKICQQENEYRKIDITAVPVVILKQVSDTHDGYSVSEAYTSEENEYRLVLNKEGKILIAYYKSTGEFIKEEMK